MRSRWLRLGVSALDKLLDREGRGLLLPAMQGDGETGGCNIVIRGRPGTGKSTLALQMARAFCVAEKFVGKDDKQQEQPCNFFSVYASLEQSPEAVREHAQEFGWAEQLDPVMQLQILGDRPSQEELGKALADILGLPPHGRCPNGEAGGKKDGTRRRVLLPRLSPRSLAAGVEATDRLFWQRYAEVESLLEAANWLCEQKKDLALGMVVVDSLNVFGDRPLGREELFRIFDLFCRSGIVGVFVLEEGEVDEKHASLPNEYDTAEYLADIVIATEFMEAEGYLLRTIQIVKSRYQEHQYGRNPFRILSARDSDGHQAGVVIYPRIHTVTSEVQEAPEGSGASAVRPDSYPPLPSSRKDADSQRFDKGYIWARIEQAREAGYVLGTARSTGADGEDNPKGYSGFHGLDNLGHFHPGRPSCIALVGQRATFKSAIGRNFALRGAVCGHHSLLITLRDDLDPAQSSNHPFEFSWDVFRDDKPGFDWSYWWGHGTTPEVAPLEQGLPVWKNTILGDRKAKKQYRAVRNHPDELKFGSLAMLNFAPGMLHAEEFLAELLHEIGETPEETRARGVKRVVVDDVERIGISYPFLARSPTSAGLFLTVLVHLLKKRGIEVMLVAGETDEPGCKPITDQVIALADVVVKCRSYDVFGQRYVGIVAEGVPRSAGPHELTVPGVFERDRGCAEPVYRINTDLLNGLVGFETGNIKRPGASLYVFQDTDTHKQYNGSLATLLFRAFSKGRVTVEPFTSTESITVHESLDVLRDKPVDRTVVVTVDEFWTEKSLVQAAPQSRPGPVSPDDVTGLAAKLGYAHSEPPRSHSHEASTVKNEPYYRNLLLLAYRKDRASSDMRWDSWEAISANAESIRSSPAVEDQRHGPKVQTSFWFDSSAGETLSCVFIDALLEAHHAKLPGGNNPKRRGQKIHTTIVSGRPADHKPISAVVGLFDSALESIGSSRYLADLNPGKGWLSPNAAVYCCWYSQLRDLLRREPWLCDRLEIRALPYGGFRGDWFLSVVKGSVSEELGNDLISMLCSEEEEYRRLVEGIGLPTRVRFRGKGFLAWPGNHDVCLDRVLEIHDCALSRSAIPGYDQFRHVLAMLFRQLVGFRAPKRDIEGVLSVLSDQIRFFGPSRR